MNAKTNAVYVRNITKMGVQKKLNSKIGEKYMKPKTQGHTPRPRLYNRSTLYLRREDFSEYGLSLGIWEALTLDLSLPSNTEEVEISVVSARKVN